MSAKILILIATLMSCSSLEQPSNPSVIKEFSRGEVILGTQLLVKVFDQEMAPLSCVPDTDEASLLLRTIRPRMEVIEDDMEALLDQPAEVDKLINTCDQSCICGYVDDLLREHLVTLNKAQRKKLNEKKNDNELNRCMNFALSTFCQGELYQELNKEKADFSFEE